MPKYTITRIDKGGSVVRRYADTAEDASMIHAVLESMPGTRSVTTEDYLRLSANTPLPHNAVIATDKECLPGTINQVLAERGSRYGVFAEHARITQAIKRAMQDSPNWESLPDDMKEALEMAAHKFGRILNGDPLYDDSWTDVIGYTQLVLNRLQNKTDSGRPA